MPVSDHDPAGVSNPRCYDCAGLATAHRKNRVGTREIASRRFERGVQVFAVAKVLLDQVRDYLSVRLGGEGVARAKEPLL